MRSATGFFDLRFWWLPDRLYDTWPFLHLLGGMLVIASFDEPTTHSSGLLFMSAGVMILAVRWWHRREREPQRRSPRSVPRTPATVRSYYNDPAG